MAQYDYGNPQSPFSGTQLNTRLRNWRDALHTLHRGTSRPSYAQAGMLWIRDVSASLWEVMLYSGTADIKLGDFNPSSGAWTPLLGAAQVSTPQLADGAVTGPKLATAALNPWGHDIRVAKATPLITADATGATDTTAEFRLARGGVPVWAWAFTANAARDALFGCFDNAGVWQGAAIVLRRATRRLELTQAPVDPMNPATKAYVDSAVAPGTGRLIGIRRITSTQSYTPPPGCTRLVVTLRGGGGGGGGGGDGSGGGGGGSGGEGTE